MNKHRAIVWMIPCLVSLGCGGGPPKQASDENNFDVTPSGTVASDTGNGNDSAASDPGKLNVEQEEQMMIALKRGGEKAANCLQVVTDAKPGEGEVQVVFDGKKGRVTDVVVGAPFAGTPTEPCIKRSFVGEIILPFEGDVKQVPYTVKLEPKKAGTPAPTASGKPPLPPTTDKKK